MPWYKVKKISHTWSQYGLQKLSWKFENTMKILIVLCTEGKNRHDDKKGGKSTA